MPTAERPKKSTQRRASAPKSAGETRASAPKSAGDTRERPAAPAPKKRAPKPRGPAQPPRSGRCAIMGRPNVGKSTLLNAMLGQKLAIATSKPQTTRTTLLGVCVRKEPPLQIAFVDTPGLHRPASALGKALVEAAHGEVQQADVVLLVTTAGKHAELHEVIGNEDRELLKALAKQERPVILALNKVDQLKSKHLLLPLIEQLVKLHPFAAVVPISALQNINIDELIEEVGSRLPEGFSYDEDTLTDRPERYFASELIREALMRATRQEVPYSVGVVIDSFEDEGKLARISATVVVEKSAHKGIVIGKGGQMLKRIGTEARQEMERMFGRKVFLELWVKVLEDWTGNASKVREMLDAESEAETANVPDAVRKAAAEAARQMARMQAAPPQPKQAGKPSSATKPSASKSAAGRSDKPRGKRDAAQQTER